MEQSGCLGSTPSLSNQPMDHNLKGWDTRRKNPDFLSLHKHPCSFTCEDKLQQCSSAVLCWREMRSFLNPALFPSTGVLHVPVGSGCPQDWGPALHPGPVLRSSWSKLIKWRGWKEASAFIGMEIFAQSIPEVTALDSSESWELPVSVLFGLYLDYLNPLHLWLILQHNWPAYKNLAALTHSLKESVEKSKCYQHKTPLSWTCYSVTIGVPGLCHTI